MPSKHLKLNREGYMLRGSRAINIEHLAKAVRRVIYGTSLVLLSFGPAYGQQGRCTLTVAQSPELRGFKLGAKIEETLARFPGTSAPKPDEFGFTRKSLQFADDIGAVSSCGGCYETIFSRQRVSGFDGVSAVYLDVLDGRISAMQISYSFTTPWNSLDEFVARVSESLKLPNAWSDYKVGKWPHKRLDCDGWRIEANAIVGGELLLQDAVAEQTLNKRKVEKEQRQRGTFKP
jgi:hypothetical protein